VLTEKRWQIESVLHLFLALALGLLLAGLVLPWAAPPDDPLYAAQRFWFFTLNTSLFHLLALCAVGAFLHYERLHWSEAFGLRSPGFVKATVLALLIATLALPASWLLIAAISSLMRAVAVEPVTQQAVQTLQQSHTWEQRAMFGIVAVLLAPVVEELLFRGILYPTIKQAGFPHTALWGTSLFFAFTHANLLTFLPLACLAMALVWLYERTNNLVAPIIAHAAFNAANFAYLVQTS